MTTRVFTATTNEMQPEVPLGTQVVVHLFDGEGPGEVAFRDSSGHVGIPAVLTEQKQSDPQTVGSLYVTPDGAAYRLEEARVEPLTDKWTERYSMLTVEGYQTVRYALPDNAVLVWSP